MARRHPLALDPLECRRCLNIVAEVDSGDLFFPAAQVCSAASSVSSWGRFDFGRFFGFGRGFGR